MYGTIRVDIQLTYSSSLTTLLSKREKNFQVSSNWKARAWRQDSCDLKCGRGWLVDRTADAKVASFQLCSEVLAVHSARAGHERPFG